MDPELEDAAYEGLQVDLVFKGVGPSFGDLFAIVGEQHPEFPPSGRFSFDKLADLGFQQVDDYFGVPNPTDEGDDVRVWLYPVVDGDDVYHHPGPFSAIRLEYCILRNPAAYLQTFLATLDRFLKTLEVDVHYLTRDVRLTPDEARTSVSDDASQILEHWKAEGIEPGSDEALMLDH